MPDGACGVESRGMREHGQPGFLPLHAVLVGIQSEAIALPRVGLDEQDAQGGLSRRDPTCLRMVSHTALGQSEGAESRMLAADVVSTPRVARERPRPD
ncbi:MAG: hypothetical protein WCD11_09850 [Solirubrobacteraceae bacterium]